MITLAKFAIPALVAAVSLSLPAPAAAEGASAGVAADRTEAATLVWKQQFGTSRSEGIARVTTDRAGNVIASGTTGGSLYGTSKGGNDIFVAKYNSVGTRLWIRQTGTAYNDKLVDVVVGGSNEVVALGLIVSGSLAPKWFLAKYNSSGTFSWQKIYSSEQPAGVHVNRAGQIFTVTLDGRFIDTYSSSGYRIWRRATTVGELFHGVCCTRIDPAGNLVVAGDSAYDWGSSIMTAKFDSTGSPIWWDQEFADGGIEVHGLGIGANGQVIVAGSGRWTNAETGLFDEGSFVKQYAADGTLAWYNGLAGGFEFWPSEMAASSSGDTFTSGSISIAARGSEAIVSKRRGADGTIEWQRVFGTPANDYANDIAIDGAGNLYVGGWTAGSLGATQKGGGDAFIVKMRPN